ncbi:MAG: hypothetical protein A3E82_00555 [Gammaproteobacteria bacterium RIFCSPHIGHO2_12_FULL_38_11]|nr:MAG: hypothetical protein A3E82_00555 [Gammaproteobacteria bacterium RIFCSPHIGHO2_12_FULL_38_11]
MKTVQWAVIGAGPAGITAVGLLLDAGVSPKEILWCDPHFQVGDFGRLWREVNSNTRVALFQKQLQSISSFDYAKKSPQFELDEKDPDGYTTLKVAAQPLQWVSDQLCQKVIIQKTLVKSLSIEKGAWQLETETKQFFAKKVILATGAEPKSLDYPGVQKIDLVTALTPSELKKTVNKNDVVAVFGSSHSAMISIRNLVEAGVQKIVNFYLSPLCYAVLLDDWILYDDTGLKGETAAWVRENISKQCLSQVSRYLSIAEHIDAQLPHCNKAIYTVGFKPRHIPTHGVSLAHYDVSNGIIAPGLFGVGIGFPLVVMDPFGRKESNVGVWKFFKNLKRTLPLWQHYPL